MKIYFIFPLLLSLFFIQCKNVQKTEKSVQNDQKSAEVAPAPTDFNALLNDSPRHNEWKTLTSNDRELYTFVTYPEISEKAKAVIVIHENRGLNEWARYFADQLAAQGYLVLAPDLLSNFKEGIEKTTDFENSDKAREAIYELDDKKVTGDLDAVYNYAKSIDAATGEVAVVGFCWGGSQTFRYATQNPDISSAHVFYGTAPDNDQLLEQIGAPVYGYYGGEDNRVNATIEQTKELMSQYGKTYEPVIYDGAGHAFMRRGAEATSDAANKKAHDEAWERLLQKLE
ncbi:MAG TPA: dienelactone hydrolase family protein [Leeuwenhoekiella sp.]|nr:dienelactone hydrolase family protein [Leeuwenhoekiella sp.]